MALTVTKEADKTILEACGLNIRIIRGTIAFDDSYPSGGEDLDLSKELPTEVQHVIIENKSGYIFEYDYANKKVKAYYFDYDAEADGAAIEVTNTGDLSAVTDVRFTAIGY